ncbi:MAG: GUN4 domain-containing protein [Cyanobacteria bacterium]|nr:GUN4 domain-containing protein [Cyanobacteriota bacterium]
MTQAYPGAAVGAIVGATDAIAKVVVQWVDAALDVHDRDGEVRLLGDRLQKLGMLPAARITYLKETADTQHCLGLQVTITEPEQIRVCLRLLYDRLLESPLECRLQILLRAVRLQLQTRNGEDLLVLPNAIETLLPARQIFQARAEAYALQGGEHSPVEKTNLELLRYRLNLPQEEADYLISRALGPYLDRQAKLRKYREVLTAELDRGNPLSEATWAELRTLYQSLGLTPADASAIDEENITRFQLDTTQVQAPESKEPGENSGGASELPPTAPMAPPPPLPPLPDYSDRYRQEFAEAIAHTLYPSEFDRGRLEQARRLWELAPDSVQVMEQDITAERYGPIDSAQGVDYRRLRQLLWSGQWEMADQETERLLLTALSPDMGPLDSETLVQLPCLDLHTLDALWRRYSQDRFGFKAQYLVYCQVQQRADEFLQTVAWQQGISIANVNVLTRRKAYRDLQFDLAAPVGHLPSWRWGCEALEQEYAVSEGLVDALFAHVEKCMPDLSPPPPSPLAA